MNRRIVYEDTNLDVHIIIPCGWFKEEAETEEHALARLSVIAIPDVTSFIVCRPENIPNDITFRDAWKKGDEHEPIKVNFKLALEVHRKRLKEACERKICQLEAERQIAITNRNTPQEVSARRTIEILKTLHEMNLTHCKTLEDLKYSIPIELHDVWNFYEPKRYL